MNDLSLVYVKPIGKNTSGEYEYEFFFSETPDIVWKDEWEYDYPCFCDNIEPDETTYNIIKRLKTNIPFFCAQENKCFPFSYVMNDIVALAFEDITSYSDFPEPYRIVFHFGEKYELVCEKLLSREITFNE